MSPGEQDHSSSFNSGTFTVSSLSSQDKVQISCKCDSKMVFLLFIFFGFSGQSLSNQIDTSGAEGKVRSWLLFTCPLVLHNFVIISSTVQVSGAWAQVQTSISAAVGRDLRVERQQIENNLSLKFPSVGF